MEVAEFARPNRATPSAWEAAFLKKSNLTLSTVEFALPTSVVKSQEDFAEGPRGSRIYGVYSKAAFDGIKRGNGIVDLYLLPHLPLGDAKELHQDIAGGNARLRISNGPYLLTKFNAYRELSLVKEELQYFTGPKDILMDELRIRRGNIAAILSSGDDVPVTDQEEAAELIIRWETELDQARHGVIGARRRLVFATLLAAFWAASEDYYENDLAVREGDAIAMGQVYGTLQRLAPDLCQRIFGTCNELPHAEGRELQKRTVVALKQLVYEIGLEMEPHEFVGFSLETSRRDLVQQLGDITHLELRTNIMKSLQAVSVALTNLQSLDEELLQPHFSRPTLLGSKADFPTHQQPYWPNFSVLSEEELEEEVRRHAPPSF
ncbi:hypothetical protein E2562_020545 [Oryza meyeriana var. granulata]|uniref:Uncharacterized protein n=1 Tax=Oryza meyeriana var. granulata TaxID=110450 RepID=A0A6G1EB18_9ORYZ|nr:hypothetical protein E2562_020545 [Oryza meyeriana var. granulata]